MNISRYKAKWLICGLGGILILSGCAGASVDLDTAAHATLLKQDRILSGESPVQGAQIFQLSLEEALRRGFTHNLDARVAALESLSQQDNVTLAQLRALPGVEATGGYVGRSNAGASSSRSILSGQQSLEPSQSTERHRRVGALEANWNLLDAALALADAAKADEEAKVAQQRHDKVIQNVERDVYNAYWRARAYQDVGARVPALLAEIDAQLAKLDQESSKKFISSDTLAVQMTTLTDRQRALRDLYDQVQMSEIELKGMLSIPQSAKLQLTTEARDISPDVKRLLDMDVSAQEWDALKNRPEMREEILQKNMTLADTRREIIQTFPGMDLILSKEYDSNDFLVDPNWTNFSAKIVQSITGILTLPNRYHAAKNKEAVADARRQALNSAIVAQVHIARQRLAGLRGENAQAIMARKAALQKSAALSKRQMQGLSSGQDALIARLDAEIETLRASLSYADFQDGYAAMLATLGKSITGQSPMSVDSGKMDGAG